MKVSVESGATHPGAPRPQAAGADFAAGAAPAAGGANGERVPVGAVSAPVAANGLDRALSLVLADIVRWINAGG
mgnify:CR=1 FL=1